MRRLAADRAHWELLDLTIEVLDKAEQLRLKHHGAVPIVRPADFVRSLGPPHSKYR